jgi:hypothetical protein
MLRESLSFLKRMGSRLLTIMGRVQLVISIISGMLVYSFHIYAWPTSLLKQLTVMIKKSFGVGMLALERYALFHGRKSVGLWRRGGLAIKDPKL